MQRFRKVVWISRLEQGAYFLAGRQSCGWWSGLLALGTKLRLQARAASFFGGLGFQAFDFIGLSATAVYPLKKRIG